jgi:hypothetical protein
MVGVAAVIVFVPVSNSTVILNNPKGFDALPCVHFDRGRVGAEDAGKATERLC